MKGKIIPTLVLFVVIALLNIGSVSAATRAKKLLPLLSDTEKQNFTTNLKSARTPEARLKIIKDKASLIIDRVIERLNQFEQNIQNRNRLSAEEKAQISNKVSEEIAWYNTQKGKLNSAKSIEEIRTLVHELRTRFGNSLKNLRLAVLKYTFMERLENAVRRMEAKESKITTTIDKLKAAGKDTSGIESDMALYRSELQNVKTLLLSASSETDLAKLRTILQNAQQTLVKAHNNLKNALQKMKILLPAPAVSTEQLPL